jgi:hypothetical protein
VIGSTWTQDVTRFELALVIHFGTRVNVPA